MAFPHAAVLESLRKYIHLGSKLDINFIPIHLYAGLYRNILLLVIFYASFAIYGRKMIFNGRSAPLSGLGNVFFAFSLIYIGFRPVNEIFVDMTTYAMVFERYAYGFDHVAKDPVFHYLTLILASFLDVNLYFFACAVLYVAPLYLASKKLIGRYWIYCFLFLVGSFSFWAYGTNGIRNGIAASLFVYGLSRARFSEKVIWVAVSIGFHLSMLIPAVCFVVAHFIKSPRICIGIWLVCIVMSITAGSYFANLFSGIALDDQRLDYLTAEVEQGVFSQTGFRWDFVLYSAAPIIAGWYYTLRKGFSDPTYLRIYSTYILSNSFWILIIQANFSNRFAYLSWFLMGIVMCYPILKQRIFANQSTFLSLLLIGYYAFTYVMVVILD